MNQLKIYPKVFMWMFIGLFVSFITGMVVVNSENMLYNIFNTNWYYFIVIAELATVIFLSARIQKMQKLTAMISFIIYSILTGLTLSIIFVAFEIASIAFVFGITSIIFLIFAAFGYYTQMDLSKLGTYLLMGLLGIILITIVNLFLKNEAVDVIVCIIGVIIFIGLIAYDMQKVKYYVEVIEDPDKAAIMGALELYLDFINIFLRLLQLFAKNRD